MTSTTQLLRNEISFLGEQLGEVIRQIEGDDAFDCIEQVRQLARKYRQGQDAAQVELAELISNLGPARLRVVIRAFTIFLNLANLAEDRHRIRVLRQRAMDSETGIRPQSIHDAISKLHQQGTGKEDCFRLLEAIDVELVFTAHPTEAKRRSVRAKLRKLRTLLQRLDHSQPPLDREDTVNKIRNELIKLWQTDLVRPKRPTVMQEVERGLSIKRALWDTLPVLMRDFRVAIGKEYGEPPQILPVVLHYGSWIGGDRDGHPYVTVDISEQAISWLKFAALDFHERECERLRGSLSFSSQYSAGAEALESDVRHRVEEWPPLADVLKDTPANEPYRRWLMVIAWRLQQTRLSLNSEHPRNGSYPSPGELANDVKRILLCLDPDTNALAIRYEVQPWLDRIAAFGFHLARLDIRQDSRVHRAAVDDVLMTTGLCNDPSSLTTTERLQLIEKHLHQPIAVDESALGEDTQTSLALMRWISQAIEAYGYEALGGYIVSMTRDASDMLDVLFLWELARENDVSCLPLIPLFETIDDLQRAPTTFESMLDNAIYQSHLAAWKDRQTIMLGYSDSTKDGGYVAACWALYEAQRTLSTIGEQREIEITYFHGRGGSLGRGGGPAARSILALPENSFHGRLRLTEQGEVLAERYDDPEIAYRHLEQIFWAALLASSSTGEHTKPEWHRVMPWMSERSESAYRSLIDDPHFVSFFRKTTPLDAIESLPIGSRPSRRKTSSGLEGLRAIPFVFSWTQCRWLVPAWFGMGKACDAMREEEPGWYEQLPQMYEEWPFFRAVIDNATLALAKADVMMATYYGNLAEGDSGAAALRDMIREEYGRTREAVLRITATTSLLERIAWLRDSIQVRNYYVDPINMIQVELLRRIQSGEDLGEAEDIDSLLHLTRLTINGIASGMRTTG